MSWCFSAQGALLGRVSWLLLVHAGALNGGAGVAAFHLTATGPSTTSTFGPQRHMHAGASPAVEGSAAIAYSGYGKKAGMRMGMGMNQFAA